MPTNVLVTGANGQLGRELHFLSHSEAPPDRALCRDLHFVFADKQALNVASKSDIASIIKKHGVDVVVNCAAYTAVDQAEKDPAAAYAINHTAVEHLAEIARKEGVKLVHISTDYVFDGRSDKPYVETDAPNPQSIYGKSKLAGERAMQAVNPKNSAIVRTSWLYSSFGNNFVKTMLSLGRERDTLNVVADQIGSPTYARDLARVLLQIIPQLENDTVEIYHYSNGGACSWYDFARAIFDIAKIDCEVRPIPGAAYPALAQRPAYSALQSSKACGEAITNWRESLGRMLGACRA